MTNDGEVGGAPPAANDAAADAADGDDAAAIDDAAADADAAEEADDAPAGPPEDSLELDGPSHEPYDEAQGGDAAALAAGAPSSEASVEAEEGEDAGFEYRSSEPSAASLAAPRRAADEDSDAVLQGVPDV